MNKRTSFSHRRAVFLIANIVATACALSFAVNAWAEPKIKQPDPRETRLLWTHVENKNCAAAVQEIKRGVKARQPDVLLMAGMMMEEGICMKADWERAVALYDLAYEAGSPTGRSAMVAALAVAGRDNARALWYAAQRPTGLPSYCYPKADPLKDPDAFDAQLERMAPDVFKACVYMAGVMHEVVGHAQFPPEALWHQVQGDLTMKFVPSSGTISWTLKRTADGMASYRGAAAQFDDEKKIEKGLLDYVTAKGNFALARYTRPEGIDPGLVLPCVFIFSISE